MTSEYTRADYIKSGVFEGDLISRKDAIDFIEKHYQRTSSVKSILSYLCTAPAVKEKSYAMGYQDGSEDGLDGIRPQGEWIEKTDKYGLSYVCPFCGKEIAGSDLNYCVKCGADMRKGGAEND